VFDEGKDTPRSEAHLLTPAGNFDAVGTTFNVDDWVAHTPKAILAKNFGVDVSVFDTIPATNPYIVNATVSTATDTGPESGLTGNSSYVFHNSGEARIEIPGGGGNLSIIDSRNFPISKTIAATVVSLAPGGLRELHWHPNVS
jgi:oxalate decarboxylase